MISISHTYSDNVYSGDVFFPGTIVSYLYTLLAYYKFATSELRDERSYDRHKSLVANWQAVLRKKNIRDRVAREEEANGKYPHHPVYFHFTTASLVLLGQFF